MEGIKLNGDIIRIAEDLTIRVRPEWIEIAGDYGGEVVSVDFGKELNRLIEILIHLRDEQGKRDTLDNKHGDRFPFERYGD